LLAFRHGTYLLALSRLTRALLPAADAQSKGWGVHWVQERKMLLKAVDAPAAEAAIAELCETGMQRSRAAEIVYGERATPVVRVRLRCVRMRV
jgi:hypothetical protein